MIPRFFRPLAFLLICGLALSLAAAPAQAFSFFRRAEDQPRASLQEREWGFFSFLVSLFGKSRGGMDPNGTGPVGE